MIEFDTNEDDKKYMIAYANKRVNSDVDEAHYAEQIRQLAMLGQTNALIDVAKEENFTDFSLIDKFHDTANTDYNKVIRTLFRFSHKLPEIKDLTESVAVEYQHVDTSNSAFDSLQLDLAKIKGYSFVNDLVDAVNNLEARGDNSILMQSFILLIKHKYSYAFDVFMGNSLLGSKGIKTLIKQLEQEVKANPNDLSSKFMLASMLDEFYQIYLFKNTTAQAYDLWNQIANSNTKDNSIAL